MKAGKQNSIEVPRWKAVVTYRSENGPIDVLHYFDEIEDLAELIENGPHWDTIERCVIKLNQVLEPGLTIEAAELL